MTTFFIGASLVVLGLVLLREFRLSMTSIRTERWRRTPGILVAYDSNSRDGDFEVVSPERDLEYTYEVEGAEFQSNHVGYGFPTTGWEYLARDAVDIVTAGAPEVTVYYDPRKPEESVLICGYQRFHLFRLLPCLLLLLLVAFIALK